MSRTLADVRVDTLRRLCDASETFWTGDEVDTLLSRGYRELVRRTKCLWDQVYLENLPAGFSHTAAWEAAYLTDSGQFDYGLANYTLDDERRLLTETDRIGPANHTSPFEATDLYLSAARASTAIPATAQLPENIVNVERPVWDTRTIGSLSVSEAERNDSRYELTKGEVYGIVSMKDGLRTVRKVRVPAQQADCFTVNGSWGLLRRTGDITADSVSGSWGCPRRISDMHPIGPERFGIPRRCYRDGKNVRLEVAREGREVADSGDVFELPDRMVVYVRDYAMWQCLAREGPAQDLALADFYRQRFERGVARVTRRMQQQQRNRVGQLGGADAGSRRNGPPAPRFPWNYGSTVRM